MRADEIGDVEGAALFARAPHPADGPAAGPIPNPIPPSLGAFDASGPEWAEVEDPALSWDIFLDTVPRNRLGEALQVSHPADAAHRARAEELSRLLEPEVHEALRHDARREPDLPWDLDLHPGEVLELVAAWHRQVASAQAMMRHAAFALVERMRELDRAKGRQLGTLSEDCDHAAAEIAMRLGITTRSARRLVDEGRELAGALGEVGEIARRGDLEASKASVLVGELAEVEPVAAAAVLEQVLPQAAATPQAELRRAVQRTLVQVDPEGEAERSVAAATARHVHPVRSRGHGMATFAATVTAPTAAALDAACEAAARAAHAAGDKRTLAQLRADALAAMAQQALVSGTVGVPGETDDAFSFDARRAVVRIIAPPRAQAGEPERPVSLVDAHAWALDDPEAADPHARSPFLGYCPPAACVAGRDVPQVVGVGPIAPRLVPALAERSWVEVVAPVAPDADDAGGCRPDAVPPPCESYRPSAALDRYVRTRDGTCQAPGCYVSAWWCDLDHVVEWPRGSTSAGNLVALCRRHHRLRTHEGHRSTRLADGSLLWRTPLGQAWLRLPDGRVAVPSERGLRDAPGPSTQERYFESVEALQPADGPVTGERGALYDRLHADEFGDWPVAV